MVPYDGDDEEDLPSEIIVNPVEFAESKAIVSASNEVPSKFKETSKELSEMWETSSDVREETRREITPLEAHINVTSMTESITNADMTLMDEIQHAVVHIIPATENIEEGNIEKEQLQEVTVSAVQSTEVEHQLASAHEMSQATVMEDVQAMELFGKGAYSKNAIQSGVMDYSNEVQSSLKPTKLNTVDKSVGTFGQCETQTMVTNHSTNAMQTDFVDLEENATQTEIRNEDSTSTQTDVTNFEEKESQTNVPDVKSQEVQTEIKVVEEQIIQTEAVPKRDSEAQTETETVPQIDAEAQTESETVPQIESESQTDLTIQNITTVDKIEIVEGIESFPMQTDEDELMQMCSFKSDYNNGDGNLSAGDKSLDKNSTSEVESNISSVSKCDEKIPVTVSAGLDMRVGEYKELTFPPVASGAQKPTQLQPPVQDNPHPPWTYVQSHQMIRKKFMTHLKGNRPQLQYLRIPMIIVDLGNLDK